MDKRQLSERDICTKFITPALEQAGWDIATQVREELPLTKGRIIVRGKLHTRAQNKRADYVLFHKPNMPIAVIEAKDNKHSLGDGMQQGLGYAEMLQVWVAKRLFSRSFRRFSSASHCAISLSTLATMRCCSSSGGSGIGISTNLAIETPPMIPVIAAVNDARKAEDR